MYIPKRYGASKTDDCPFCGKVATIKNEQGIAVCRMHQTRGLPDIKCKCDNWLDLQQGKYGPYFRCSNCGTINFKQALEATKTTFSAESQKTPEKPVPQKRQPKEITVRSDEVDFLFE